MRKNLLTILTFLAALSPVIAHAAPAKQASEIPSAMYYQEDEEDFESYEETTAVIYDPMESVNRKIFAFNDVVDRYFLEYVAIAYRDGVPQPARKGIRNFLLNLTLPVSAVNSIFQGKFENGMATFSNFLINSTIGIGGLRDVAADKGIRYRPEDFGQTLGFYGSNSGAYIIIPILGPSSTRDLTGWLADKAINPIEFNLLEVGGKRDLLPPDYRLGIALASGLDKRENLIDIIDDIRKESFDPYATIRSAYLQKRISEVKN